MESEMTRAVLDRDIVVDRILDQINGPYDQGGAVRKGHLTRERCAKVLDLMKGSFSQTYLAKDDGGAEPLAKDVNVSTGLTFYDLRAPALNLFPTVTPLRNSIARKQRPNPGDAAHWKSVTGTTGSGIAFMGWVPERRRAASMSYTTTNSTLSYATLGEEDSLSDEARAAAMGFEDEDALVQLRLMLKFFVKEEAAILGGNNSLSLTTPTAPTLSASGTGGTLPAITYSVKVVALTQEGYQNASLANGVVQVLTVNGNDGNNFNLNGGSSNISAATTQAVSSGNTLFMSTPAVTGAVAYAWYFGAAGSETLQIISTINSASFNVATTAGRQAATAITTNCSNNNGIAFDGLLTTAFLNAGTNAYVSSLATGTSGTGTGLTSSGAGGINEIDTMLRSMWDNYRVGPSVLYVNSQELLNMTHKVLNGAAAPLLRYNVAADQNGVAEYQLTAAGTIAWYFNPFLPNGGAKIPVKVHPNLAPGTIIGWAETLPPWYVSNEVPAVAEMLTRRDLYTEDWTRTTRAQYWGMYAQEALAIYAPFCLGCITNIGNV
jgi:hypothetical protein